MAAGACIVVDIGKTVSKVTLWSRAGALLDRQVRPNAPCLVDGLRRLDTDGIGAWLIAALARYAGRGVDTIIPVGHGAAVAAIADGALAVPPLDYEQALPADILADYRAARDPFACTGSPALPDGLNFGAQLYWLDRLDPPAMAAATLLPWAQYWAWFLSGGLASEITSLGCHSDVWAPCPGRFSPLAVRMGWAARFAPMRGAGDVIGTLRPDLAARTGLPPTVRVLAGLHDSNAALLAARGLAAIAGREATILSTGTWFIAMRLPHTPVAAATLAERRDCLVNVDVDGQAVPSARFMGGREIESVVGIDSRRVDIAADQPALLGEVAGLLRDGTMLLPTLAPGCGPFPASEARWRGVAAGWPARRAAACLYAALVADVALDLVGARERLLVEGRFAAAEVFVRALAALRPDMQVYTAEAHNGVSFGALRLAEPALVPQGRLRAIAPLDADLAAYRATWRANVGEPA